MGFDSLYYYFLRIKGFSRHDAKDYLKEMKGGFKKRKNKDEEVHEAPSIKHAQIALDFRPLEAGDKVVDLGCCGMELKTIAGLLDENYVGVDYYSKANVKWDLNKTPYPFPDKSFDVVFCLHVLEHLENPFTALKEMKRITKKDIVLELPNAYSWKDLAINLLKVYHPQEYGSHVFSFTWQNMDGLARKLGLKLKGEGGKIAFTRHKIFLLSKD